MENLFEHQDLKLWYRNPANIWEEALPIGNGFMGGMVFGRVNKERIQLNEDSVWSGGPLDRNNPDCLENLKKIQSLLLDGKVGEAQNLVGLTMIGTPEGQRQYQTLGDLYISFLNPQGEAYDYHHELDLNTAITSVSYKRKDVQYEREVFVSFVDQVMVVRLTAHQPHALRFFVNLVRGTKEFDDAPLYLGQIFLHEKKQQYLDQVVPLAPDTIMARGGTLGEKSIAFRTGVKAICEDGRVSTKGDSLFVEDATAVTLLIAAGTSFRYENPEQVCLDRLKNASEKPYIDIKNDHIKNYQNLFHRTHLKLVDPKEEGSAHQLPTNERLLAMKAGKHDTDLVNLYFQFGRYLLISSSRPGSLPATLQGIWNKDMLPPWDSKYTININIQMNYWHAESTHLSELHLPLFDLIERMRISGKHTAQVMYGCRGFVAHHNTDIWADTAPQDSWASATFWPMGAAWLCLHIWEHYRFNQDLEFLKKHYDAIKEATLFFVDFLIEDHKGQLVTCPSLSPENAYYFEEGHVGYLTAGPTMDNQILFELFTACIHAAKALHTDEAFVEQITLLRDQLPKMQVGKHGQIQEWDTDYDEQEPGHRHVSQLFGLHPGNQITVLGTPELALAARKTLERRLAHGGGHTGWSRAWMINLWARLLDGEKVYENLLALITDSTLPNLLDNHPPFQIDGNFGGTAGVTEMLLQSHGDEIHLLPALPVQWSTGAFTGFKARGGYEIDLAWKDGNMIDLKIYAKQAGLLKVRFMDQLLEVTTQVKE